MLSRLGRHAEALAVAREQLAKAEPMDSPAAVEEVWKLLFDPARFPDWWVGVETVRPGAPGEFTQWPAGYPDFPMPQKLRVDQANGRITVSCQVSSSSPGSSPRPAPARPFT